MKNFISVALPDRKAKKAVLEKMLRSVNAPLNEKKSNYEILEGKSNNIILKLEIPNQLSESASDNVAYKLSEGLFGIGYSDFDIEVSTDGTNKQTLSDTAWHINEEAPLLIVGIVDGESAFREKDVDTSLPSVDIVLGAYRLRVHGIEQTLQGLLDTHQGKTTGFRQLTKIKTQPGAPGAGPKSPAPKIRPVVTNKAAPGSDEALMAIVTQYAKPGMTLADVNAMETAAVSSERQGGGLLDKFTRFAKSKSWRVKYVLANAAEKAGLPGLYNSKGYFCFMAKASDDGDGGQTQGGVSSSAGASFKQMLTLAKVGLMPEKKLTKITKSWSYDSKQMIKVNEIIAAQKAATQTVKPEKVKPEVKPEKVKPEVIPTQTDTGTQGSNTGKFDNLSEEEAKELYFDKMNRLQELLRANPEPRTMQAESMKKILRNKLHNNYMFEDAAADKEIAELVADLEALSRKVSPPNRRLVQPLLKQAQPYLRRNKAITNKPVEKPKGDTSKICDPDNPLAIFAKSGKGGLKNDPDEIAAVKELQKYLGVTVDGKYGSATKSAVTAYQKQYGLKVDSDAGPETIGHMMKQCKAGKPTFADNNPNKGDGGGAVTDVTVPVRPKKSTSLTDGVAPVDEQTNDKVIKFNWKSNSYYIDVKKITVNIPENKIVWRFYKDESMKNPQKVDILAEYWVLKIEAELVRRGETDSLKIIEPITGAGERSYEKPGERQAYLDKLEKERLAGGITGTDDSNTTADDDSDDDKISYEDGLMMQGGMYIFKNPVEFSKKMNSERYKGKVKEGDTVLVGQYRYEEYGVYLIEFEGQSNLEVKKGPYKKPTDKIKKDDLDKKGGSTGTDTPNKDAKDGSASTGTDAPVIKTKTTSAEDKEKANDRASDLWDQMDNILDDDEEAYGDILSQIKTKQEFELANVAFLGLAVNDEKETIVSLAKAQMNMGQLEKNVFVHLRRLKIGHSIGPGNFRLIDGPGRLAGIDKDMSRFYDPRTGKYKGN